MEDYPEGRALNGLMSGFGRLRADTMSVLKDRESRREMTRAARTLLKSPLLRELLHPNLLAAFEADNWRRLPKNLSRIRASADPKRIFSGTDGELMLRDGFINFPAFVEKLGFIADFYADVGHAQNSAWNSFLNACAPVAPARTWSEIRDHRVGDQSCGDRFRSLVRAWRASPSPQPAKRLGDVVGASLPTLVSTSVLRKRGVLESFQRELEKFHAYRPASFRPGFDAFHLGYFAPQAALDRLSSAAVDPAELVGNRRVALGARPWRVALLHSITEPGLASGQPYPSMPDTITSGGWVHVDHSKALRAIGCDHVAFVTATGDESGFPIGIARLIGANDEDIQRMYSLEADRFPRSDFARAIEAADGVLCTRWESLKDGDQSRLIHDAMNAPFEARAERLRRGALANSPADIGVRGCSASLPPRAR